MFLYKSIIQSNPMYYTLVISFLFSTSICFLIDYFKLLNKNVLQDEIEIYKAAFPTAAYNIIILSSPIIFIQKYLITYRSKHLIEYIADFYLYYHIYSCMFYLTHRILHNSLIYRHYHKKHHKYKYPNAAVTFYAHWLDYYISNLFPGFAAFMIINPTPIEAQIAISIGIMNTIFISHGGYSSLSRFHYNHHITTNYNYGLEDNLDKLYNTKLLTL